MKLIAVIISCLSTGCAMAQSPCEKMEYAKLKDSNQRELNEWYCSAMQKARLNEDLYEISKEAATKLQALGANNDSQRRNMRERGDAQMTCLNLADELALMMGRKFMAKPPPCPNVKPPASSPQ